MRIGINATPAELAATLAAFPGVATCRVFGAVNKGIPAWSGSAMSTLIKAGVIPWPSFKDWPADGFAITAVKTWLTAMPPTVSEVWLTYHHEPEGDLQPREFRRRWAVLAKAVRAHPNANRVKLIPIHTLYPSRHKMWDRYTVDWTQWAGVWQQWAPTDSAGNYLGDAMGWDCYLETTATDYEDPARFFCHPIGAAHSVGVPLVVPELGAVRVPTDSTGTARAAWITECVDHLTSYGATAVNWWHATGTNGRDYRLDDEPSKAAWREAIDYAED